MSELLIIAFDDEQSAFDLAERLQPLKDDMQLETQDTTIMTRDAEGDVHLHNAVNVPLAQTAGGTVWGLLIGAAFAMPVAGALAGAATGAMVGRERDPGVNSDFLKELGATLKPGSSAVCLLVRHVDRAALDEVLEAFTVRGHLLQSPYTPDEEGGLRSEVERPGP